MFYHEGNRHFQDLFDTRRLADRLQERTVVEEIDDEDKQFIESRDMFFLATVDARGLPNCSYKGGDPGFVRVVDSRTIAFPNYDGNGMYLSIGNLHQTGHVGLLFVDFENPRRVRLNGEATVQIDDPLRGEYPEAQFVVRVAVRELFANCPRYIHRMKLTERSKFVPHGQKLTPVPDWKRAEFVADVLPAHDPAREGSEGGY